MREKKQLNMLVPILAFLNICKYIDSHMRKCTQFIVMQAKPESGLISLAGFDELKKLNLSCGRNKVRRKSDFVCLFASA